jgi:hypothetical protein
MTKVRRGNGQPTEHEGDVEALIDFMGYDLLELVKRSCEVTQTRKNLLFEGEIMGGIFKLSVTFNGKTRH